MNAAALTPLEIALLEKFYTMYKDLGFPPPGKLSVRARVNTGAGRFVDLHAEADSGIEDGYLDLGGQFIDMDGIPNGLMAVVLIKNGRPNQLEIAVYGDDPWDGSERRWSIV